MSEFDSIASTKPVIERMRLESVRRNLIVTDVRSITPRMLRVTLGGEELAGFHSPSPDDHIKLFFPEPGGGVGGRDYTPRHFEREAHLLSVDFFLHEGGLGSAWAQQARPGDALLIGGPRGSSVITAPQASWLLIGDETALPSVARRLEEMAAGTRVTTVIAVTGREEEQPFATKAELSAQWVHRPDTQAADPAPILKALSELKLEAGPRFVWIAVEKEVSQALRNHFTDTLGHPAEWIRASSYWSKNQDEDE